MSLITSGPLGGVLLQIGMMIGAARVPDNEGHCAGNGFPWLRSAHLSEYRAVASSA
jgi:hypothetical protein